MRRYTIEEIEARLPPTTVQTPTSPHPAGNVVLLHGRKSAVFERAGLPDMNAAAQANLSDQGFGGLSPERRNAMLAAMLSHAPIAAMADRPRPEWLPILFALADAERLAATDARRLALKWCKTSPRFAGEGDFLKDWNSFKPGGTTVGTLLARAGDTGFDTAAWFADDGLGSTVVAPSGFFVPARFDAADLHAVEWIVDALLIAKDISVLSGQGGGAKTASAIGLAVALAAGRGHFGPLKLHPRADGAPRRVGYISAEEDPNRLGLLVAAACSVQKLDAAERASVRRNLVLHDARASGWKLGEARPGERETIAPEAHDRYLKTLRDALATERPDVVMLDTAAALLGVPNENDNAAVTALLSRLARVASGQGCAVLLLHHTPKLTKENAAAQRGEPTLVRGGGAFTNSARAVFSITGLPATEAGLFVLSGVRADSIRRLDCVKLNDRAPPDPVFLEVSSVPVQVRDGTFQSVRAVGFVASPKAANAGGIADAIRNLAMRVIDAGVIENGITVPLSPGGGRNNGRDAVAHIARALQGMNQALSEVHAKAAAKTVLTDLRDRIGCVVEADFQLPRYKTDGKPNGTRKARGLSCRWDLAPWMPAPLALPAPAPQAAPAVQPPPAAQPAQAPQPAQSAVACPPDPLGPVQAVANSPPPSDNPGPRSSAPTVPDQGAPDSAPPAESPVAGGEQ